MDLDLWVEPESTNAKRVYVALAKFGAPLDTLGVTSQDFVTPNMVSQFGVPPHRIDILTSISGVEFGAAWEERTEAEIEGVRVPIIGLQSFIANKRASGRKKDLADLESLGAG